MISRLKLSIISVLFVVVSFTLCAEEIVEAKVEPTSNEAQVPAETPKLPAETPKPAEPTKSTQTTKTKTKLPMKTKKGKTVTTKKGEPIYFKNKSNKK